MNIAGALKPAKIRQLFRIAAENLFMSLPVRRIPANSSLIAVWTAPRITNNVGDRALTEGSLAFIPRENSLLIARDGEEYAQTLAKLFLFPQKGEAGKFVDFVKYIRKFKKEIGSCAAVIIVGADIMDGKYGNRTSVLRWNLAKWLAERSIPTALYSMSWNTAPTQDAKNAAVAASLAGVKIFTRDELSRERLTAIGAKAELACDISFLRSDEIEPDAEIFARFSSNTKKVLVNVSDWVSDNYAMFETIQNSLRSLSDDYEIIYVPMVHYGTNTDTVACQKLAEQVGGWVLPLLPTPSELRWMARRAEFSISARMHCCLIGFNAGLPSIGLEYQGKFQGAFKVFGLERFAIQPENFVAQFEPAFAEITNSANLIRASIYEQLKEIQKSAEKPVAYALSTINKSI
ncbi:MAG: polysaccharide pyruvyl transferase family protein [Actinomycetales bacterium]|nr:polysaccharide pyruvyl transferase family protein [Actinomycetales bacterium]